MYYCTYSFHRSQFNAFSSSSLPYNPMEPSPSLPNLLKLLSHLPGTKLASAAAMETRESTMEVFEVSIAIMNPSFELAELSGRFSFDCISFV